MNSNLLVIIFRIPLCNILNDFVNMSFFLSYFNLLRGKSNFLLVTRGITYSLYMYELHVYCDFNYDIMFCAILMPCYLQYFGVGISANRVDSLSSSISAILIILSKKDSGLEYTKKFNSNGLNTHTILPHIAI